MEFKQLTLIVWQRKSLFLFVFLSVIFLVGVWFFSQPKRYEIVFSIDVARENYQKTKEYRYDQFYRLQADEKFSDTIVRWFDDPSFNREIQKNYEGKDFFMEELQAERLSSNYLRISFKTDGDKDFLILKESIEKTLKERVSMVNNEARDPNWFAVLVGSPVISEQKFNFKLVFLGAFLTGFVLGVFISLLHYYWNFNENRN